MRTSLSKCQQRTTKRRGRSRGTRPRFAGHQYLLRCELLEDRRLLSSFTLQEVLGTYDGGAGVLLQDAANIASQAFGQNAHIDIPLIGGTLDSAGGGLTQDIKTPFQTDQLDINAAWTTIQQQLANAGFTVQNLLSSTFTGSQDTNGDLLRVKWTSPPKWNTTPVVCVASGQTGFDDFNQITSGLLTGVFSASAPTISFQVTLGVDVQTISGVQQLSF